MNVRITPQLLIEAVGCTADLAHKYAPALNQLCGTYGVLTPQRLAMFLAQLGHESGSFRYVREIASGAAYEGRKDLGNTQPGDGERYRGRGLIQVTGRHNYRAFTQRIRVRYPDAPDFEAEPEKLEELPWAVLSALDYWYGRGLNELADTDQFDAITKRINGGLNGKLDRDSRLVRARRALSAAPAPLPPVAPSPPTPLPPVSAPAPEPTLEKRIMPFPAILAALLPTLANAVPDLIKLIKPDSDSAGKNAEVASRVFEIAGKALGAANAQDVVERVTSSPEAAQAVSRAVRENWFELQEVGGGVESARKVDLAFSADPTARVWRSPSFLAMLVMTPLVYMIVGSVAGLWGYTGWSDEVRTAIGTTVISLIVGGAAGYYWGSTTSRNKPLTDTSR